MIPYQYTAIYRILGITLPQDMEGVQLIRDPAQGLSAWLTRRPDDRAAHVDRSTSLADLMLGGITGRSEGLTLETALPPRISARRSKRKEQYGDGPFLIVHGEGSVESLGIAAEATREFDSFVVSLGGVPSAQIKGAWADARSTVIAAVALTSGKPIEIDLLADGTVFFPEHGKPHHVFNMEVGEARLVVSSPLTQDQIRDGQDWYSKLATSASLSRVWRLLVASLGFADDRLRGFMNSWSALEILVNKLFARYSTLFFNELRSGEHPEVRSLYVDRISNVMKDKYRLADKFAIVASYLAPAEADADFVVFERIKSQRDALMHGQDVTDSALHVAAAQGLAQKYLRLHLARV